MSTDAGQVTGGLAPVPGFTMVGEAGLVCDGDVCWIPETPGEQPADNQGAPVPGGDDA